MAETQQKRLREEINGADFDDSNSKRQKPYNTILSLLDEDEEDEEPNQDLSAIFTTLEQELSSSTAFDFVDPPFPAAEAETEEEAYGQKPYACASSSDLCSPGPGDCDEGVKSVMRHLLEASDDELGIPNTEDKNSVEIRSAENFPFAFVDNGLWELEDVAANYYAMLQSELFM